MVWFDRPLDRLRVGMLVVSALVVLTALVELGSYDHPRLLPRASAVLLVGSFLLLTFARPGPALMVVRALAGLVLGAMTGMAALHLADVSTGAQSFGRHLSVYLANLYPFTGWLGGWTPSWLATGLLGEGALLLLLATLGLGRRSRRTWSRDPRGLWG